MKIVFVSEPLSTGGAERVVAALANSFLEKGNEVKIIVVDNGDDNVYYTHPDIEFIHIRKPKNPIVDLTYRAITMRRFFSDYNPDVIIPFTTQKNVSVLLASLFSRNTVISCERNNPREDPSNVFLRVLRKMLYWTSEGFVFQTRNAQEYFSKSIQQRSIVIPNPLSNALIEPWRGKRKKTIVMASRLNPQKNLEMAIESFRNVRERHPDYILKIFGKSYQGSYEYENKLKQMIENGNLSQNVFLEGFSDNLHENIKDATVFLLTSNHEGMSNSLMEAMALGLPCISTDDPNGGAKSLIQDHVNGILIPVGDTQACTNSLLELIENDQLRHNISENAVTIRETLDISKISETWLSYIKEVVKNNKGG